MLIFKYIRNLNGEVGVAYAAAYKRFIYILYSVNDSVEKAKYIFLNK